ncbi:MAG: Gfo/Idh/MocA family oxidoreductase [Cyclobacteriaceae bacterium]
MDIFQNQRRDFIKKTALGAGSIGLVSSSVFANELSSPAQERLGIALVGLGNYATGQLAPALEQTENCYLAGIVTGTPEKAESWKAKYNLKSENIYDYNSFDEIANNDEIDAVYIVLPNSMHAEYVIRAAKAGKQVICEKPMALTAAEGQTMIDACTENGVTLSIGYRLQYDPYHNAIITAAQEKTYGEMTYVSSQFGFKIGDPTQWRLKKALAGGGAMMDVGIYCIQAARYIFDAEPIAVTAQEFKTDDVKFAEVDETITWQMEFPDGRVSNHTTSYAFGTNHLMVSAERTRAMLEPAYSYGGLKGYIGDKVLDFGKFSQQALQLDAMAVNIVQGKPSKTSGKEGLADLKVIDAIYQSLANGGKRVTI